MIEKEKEAIERLNRILIAERENNNIGTVVRKSDLQAVLNLIQKQTKEIDKHKLDKQKIIERLEENIKIIEKDSKYNAETIKHFLKSLLLAIKNM